eukprot:6045205-Karenia_brevis.AAC.1
MRCQYKFKFREYDGAPANDTLSAHLMNEDISLGALSINAACGNHANVLAQNAVLVTSYATPSGPKFNLLNDLYASSLFMRMGFFIKIVAAIPLALKKHLRLELGDPPIGATMYTQELQRYLVSVFRYNRPQSMRSDGNDSPSAKVIKNYIQD